MFMLNHEAMIDGPRIFLEQVSFSFFSLNFEKMIDELYSEECKW